jgi:hypothetical protein
MVDIDGSRQAITYGLFGCQAGSSDRTAPSGRAAMPTITQRALQGRSRRIRDIVNIGSEHYLPAFRDHEIGAEILRKLTE